MAVRIDIAGNMLEWAITRAGYSLGQYLENSQDVAAWVRGEKKPTIKQLEAFAKGLHVPFGYLFLQKPPVEKSPIPFFRGGANSGDLDLNTYDTVLDLQRRQEWLVDYLSENDFEKKSFVGSMQGCNSAADLVSTVRKLLGLEPTWAFSFHSNESAVNHVAELFEELGIVVTFNGVVGNNTRRPIDVNQCRGFALVDDMAPFIFVNSADSKTAQLFTLIHEFVHLLLGVSSGYGGNNGFEGDSTERLCDKASANFLVPEDALRANWTNVEQTAKKFRVSGLVVARRAKDVGLITGTQFKDYYAGYLARPVQDKARRSGGDFNLVARKRIGITFAVYVHNAVRTSQLSQVEAYRLTGLYGKTYTNFMSKL
ncbi:MAG: ImmA/IrrE family metallo-endopeptidase [Bacteroidales bacterium]|nr:ImmA/IrrE family metallo-endopeptidase [Bacteroidales bacterium]